MAVNSLLHVTAIVRLLRGLSHFGVLLVPCLGLWLVTLHSLHVELQVLRLMVLLCQAGVLRPQIAIADGVAFCPLQVHFGTTGPRGRRDRFLRVIVRML